MNLLFYLNYFFFLIYEIQLFSRVFHIFIMDCVRDKDSFFVTTIIEAKNTHLKIETLYTKFNKTQKYLCFQAERQLPQLSYTVQNNVS